MTIRPIILAPDPHLNEICSPVEQVDNEVRELMDDLLDTMYRAPGIGLAAPQLGVTRRVIVVDVSRTDEERKPFRLANPKIVWHSEELFEYEEGCLSFPDHYASVARPEKLLIRYLDYDNAEQELEAGGLLAVALQHEMDHLDGVLFVQYLSKLKRDLILRKMRKVQKHNTKHVTRLAKVEA